MNWIKQTPKASDYSWRTLTTILSNLGEEEVLELLKSEKKNEKRWSILQRLHQRYNTLRVARERVELFAVTKK
jgi:hypothetical protein